jgi:hypothetical protein
MHNAGNDGIDSDDAQMARRVTRVVYHKDYNTKTQVNIGTLSYSYIIIFGPFLINKKKIINFDLSPKSLDFRDFENLFCYPFLWHFGLMHSSMTLPSCG